MTATRHDSFAGRAIGPAFSVEAAAAAASVVAEANAGAADFATGGPALRLLIVPGLDDSGPAHWQSRWQARWPHAVRVQQRDWSKPQLEQWAARVSEALQQSSAPTVIVAHSFGCLASLYAKAPSNLLGALLVAPASPDKFGIAAALSAVRPSFVTRVIASRDDPWMAFDDACQWARRWGSVFTDAGALGHINADSALGEWEFGLEQLRQLLFSIGLVQADAA